MKRFVYKVLAWVAYWGGADALFYWLNRKAKRILTFHNVLPDAMFRRSVANGVSNSLSEFEAIVDECAKRFRFSTDLFDAKTMTITFDDGYRNQYTTAFKALQKRGIQAYLFVSGGLLANGSQGARSEEPLLIDKLLHWVSEAPLEYIPGGNRLQYWVNEVWPGFMADSASKGKDLFAKLCAKYPYEKIVAELPAEYVGERLAGISDEELGEMRNAGWKIGWHTRAHYPLSRLNDRDLAEELTSPKEFQGVCFSYPYGNLVEVGQRAIGKVRELGYPCAVSNVTKKGEPYSRWFLPRFALLPDKYLIHFELSGFKHFLKHGKLLPKICGDRM